MKNTHFIPLSPKEYSEAEKSGYICKDGSLSKKGRKAILARIEEIPKLVLTAGKGLEVSVFQGSHLIYEGSRNGEVIPIPNNATSLVVVKS